ncbi:MAG: Na+/H+ antiporter NhaA [Thermomicrobiales bacterium]|nr:Na+/H+ antiporter NhaA [Thermomicrobiales bacterium]
MQEGMESAGAIDRSDGFSLREFIHDEAFGGILLLVCALIALLWVNSPWGATYDALWSTELAIGIGNYDLTKTLLHWINDGLMAIFFLAIGLEIKRELVAGELASRRRAALPVAAAVGGAVLPAVIYLGFNANGPGAPGWGVPMATDPAFALGLLALLGNRVPLALRVFLTALAIVDDVVAVLVIAVFYAGGIDVGHLAIAGVILVGLLVASRAGVRSSLVYIVLGFGLWLAFLESGVHTSIAGVLLALTIPARSTSRDASSPRASMLERWERTLVPWVAFAIVPLFALANAGVALGGDVLSTVTEPVALGVIIGLLLGKQLGIILTTWLVVRLGLAALPSGVSWRQLYGVSWLAGIGFTTSLFIAGLAFGAGGLLDQAKVGILVAAIIAGLGGWVVLSRSAGARPRSDARDGSAS